MLVELAFAISIASPIVTMPMGALPQTGPDVTLADFILPVQRVVRYPAVSEMRILSAIALSPPAQTSFDTEFAPASYFGAFAVSKDGGWGFAVASNTLGAAHEIAIQQCVGANVTQCRVIAEIIPPGYVPAGAGDVTISPQVLQHYADTSTNIVPFATAVSADGAYSKVWAMPSQAEADATALSDCEGNRVTNLPGLSDMPCILLPPPSKK